MSQEVFNFFSVCTLAGGIALFLYGMSIMGAGLERMAGGKMESILQHLTSSVWKSVLLGAVVTGIIQSSAGTTVMVIGLVNSGILQLSQAIGVIMGANIGTTITGQLIRLSDISGNSLVLQLLKPSTFAPLVAFAGAVLFVFFKTQKKRNAGQIMMGFGMLFTGMQIMEQAVYPLRHSELFIKLFTQLQNPVLGVLAGILVTVAIQSSSASVGILQALSSTGVVTWSSAIPIILGQNIGTCSTPLMASVGASKGAKRSAVVHLYFNIIGTLVFMAAIYGIQYTIGFSFWNETMNMGDIANFHTLFNVLVTVLFMPFTKLLAKLAEMTIKDKPGDIIELEEMPVLDERLLSSPSVAIQQAKNAVELMARNARENCAAAVPLLFHPGEDVRTVINQRESMVDKLEVYVSNYLLKITDKELSEAESHAVTELLYYVVEYERIGDYAINVADRSGEIADKELEFSSTAKRELALLSDAVNEILEITYQAFHEDSVAAAERVEPLEETIDALIDALRTKHVHRLKDGVCAIESGIIFLEILTNLERVGDHCSNIAARIIGAADDENFDAHELRRRLHVGMVANYNEMLRGYRQKYLDALNAEDRQDAAAPEEKPKKKKKKSK